MFLSSVTDSLKGTPIWTQWWCNTLCTVLSYVPAASKSSLSSLWILGLLLSYMSNHPSDPLNIKLTRSSGEWPFNGTAILHHYADNGTDGAYRMSQRFWNSSVNSWIDMHLQQLGCRWLGRALCLHHHETVLCHTSILKNFFVAHQNAPTLLILLCTDRKQNYLQTSHRVLLIPWFSAFSWCVQYFWSTAISLYYTYFGL